MSFIPDFLWEEKEVLITVKAYPNHSTKYHETVCVAGITGNQWIRLYPIQFRSLDYDKQFTKYDIIKVKVVKHSSDNRPETYRPNQNSFVKIHHLDSSKNGWEERKKWVLPTLSESMCEIQRLQKSQGKSLGVFKPKDIMEFSLVQDEWSDDEEERAFQLTLFDSNKPLAERIPFSFKYHYRCSDPNCKGHRMKVVDWEAGQLYRNLRDHGNSMQKIQEKMKQKWLYDMFSPKRDSYFFVGSMRKHPQSFIILGVFWPPKVQEQ